jgi:superfamily II DNA/RNA helicase
VTSFADLGVPTALVARLAGQGITDPFPIQTATLPDSLAGRDVLGRGRTGSGKTLAFALPLVVRLAGSRAARRRPRGLVLCPTRELATQIDATLAPLAAASGLRTTTIFGGVAQSRQVAALDAGVDIVVACPGRLEDLLNQRLLTLDDVEITVLDEADHMADLGFLPGVKRILDRTPNGGQRMLFSATLDNGVDVLVRRYLSSPVHHSVDSAESPVTEMTHHVLEVADAAAKQAIVRRLAGGTGRRVLFMRTKHQAKKLAKQLTAEGIAAVDLHGNLGQSARERNLAAFGCGEATVLVATDIAARGIHVDDVELVVHVDPPAEHKAYLHRSGRTARAGAAGVVVTLVLPEQRADVRAMTRAAKITAQPRAVAPGDQTVERLAGPQAPRRAVPVAPVQPVKAASAGGSSRGRGRGRGAAPSGAPAQAGRGRNAGSSSAPARAHATSSAAPARTRGSAGASNASAAHARTRGSAGAPTSSTPTSPAAGRQNASSRRPSRRASAPAGTPATLAERSRQA